MHNAAGAPNISGMVDGIIGGSIAKGSGALGCDFKNVHDLAASPSSGDQDKQYRISISATLSNSVYGKYNTIMPSSINVLSIIYLGK